MEGLLVTGYCRNCTIRENYVFHDVPWCPHIPAVIVDVDTNCSRPFFPAAPSRPVVIGELVLIVDYGDGEDSPFVTWAHVVRVTPDGDAETMPCADGYDNWLHHREHEPIPSTDAR